jgi:hypothetical protein
MTRRQLSLGEPPEACRDLQGFPRSKLGPETTLYRVARNGRNPWWFNSSGSGRFDLPEPDGTCYLAADPLAAVLEVVGPDRRGGLIAAELLAARRLFELRVPDEHSLANLTSRRAARFGMTLEIHSLPSYERTQAWARCLAESGAGGLRYFARHDPAAGRSVALFGPAGERDWDRGAAHDLEDRAWIERLWSTCRIRVASRPYADEIPVIE